ncbi:MAG: thiamine-phosphate kinase [Gammaproteobacteria bacterium]|jgi:thiamine-monophosphate kinase|nr:thiamine-phosphate kinase [Gammaproteobacteria bacterium]
MSGEFDLIRRHFRRPSTRADVRLGVGDDAALLRVPSGRELVVAMDTLVEGVHFLPDVDPAALGHKALAVNLSDLAAMGAEPAWATLALTLPAVDEDWIARFCAGFFALAERFEVDVVGGDTTRGPRAITVQAHGFVPSGAALLRSAARPGDAVYVTGTLGDAGLALLLATARLGGETAAIDGAGGDVAALRDRLDRPTPRIAEGIALRGLARACIDVSDGLYADLSHILEESGVGATVELGALPLSRPLRAITGDPRLAGRLTELLGVDAIVPSSGDRAAALRAELALGSGDDYELCFTVPPEAAAAAEAALDACGSSWARIGVIEAGAGLRCRFPDGRLYHPRRGGHDHFADTEQSR